MLSHCTYLFVEESQNVIVLMIRTMGAVGVDLFFVLSGYLIGGLMLKEIQKGHTDFLHLVTFWKRRWLRTLPNYFLILLLNIALFYLFTNELSDNLSSYFVFLQNFSSPHPDFFTEVWSLSIEEYAYLVLPAFMFVAFALFKRNQTSLFLWTTVILILLGFLLKLRFYVEADIDTYKDWSAGFRKVVIYRLDSIYMGFLLIYIIRKSPLFLKKWKFILLSLGLFIFTGLHLLIYKLQLQPQTHLGFFTFVYLPIISICCALIFPYAIHTKRLIKVKNLIYFVSTRSYAIYLINFSLILMSIHNFFDVDSIPPLFKLFLCLIYLTLTVVLSNLIYLYFERPILRYRDRIR
ncbi:MAG: acyltransferase [Aquaticitalea sp.]